METFKGKITEFVDWTSGIDELTGSKIQGVSEDTPISGKSIRDLLLEKLKKPFIKYDDPTKGLYIFFSSEDAKNEWLRLTDKQNPYYGEESEAQAAKLPITTMPRPADTAIIVRPVLENGVEDASESAIGNARYILSDSTASSDAEINYTVRMVKEAGGSQQPTSDSFSVTYTVTDANGGTYVAVDDYDSDKVTTGANLIVLSFNCRSRITEGANNVNLRVTSKNSGAEFNINIPIYLIKFTLSSTFDFSKALQQGGTISVPFVVNRSVSGMLLKVVAEVCNGAADNKVFTAVASHTTTSSDNPYTGNLEIHNVFPANVLSSDHISHTLLLKATLEKIGSSTNGFSSNTLVYTLETASSQPDLVNKFINISYNAPANKLNETNGVVTLYATQYEPFSLGWAYYTDHARYETDLNISWYLRYKNGQEYEEMLVGSGRGQRETISAPLNFIPEIYQDEEDGATLVAKRADTGDVIDSFPIIIAKSSYNVLETSDVKFKISAFGKSNQSNDRDQWIDSISGATTTFTNIPFDDRCGWNDDSLSVQGSGQYATIQYCPITKNYELANKGKTIEIEFTPVKSNNDNDVLVSIGDPAAGHIDIKPNGAFLYIGNSTTDVVHTNYKVGERIKLAFVFNVYNNPSLSENGLVYIINNGVLERAAEIGYVDSYGSDSGNIVIGGTDSGVRVYNMRIYDKALTPMLELNNYIYDYSDKPTIISRNQLFENGELFFGSVKNKIDSILIEGLSGSKYGGLSKILTMGGTKENSETTVNIRRTCTSDDTKSFYILKALIRKHGQSTLNYPITSLKLWFNKSSNNPTEDTPVFEELSETQRALNLNKNRYIMKAGAIPANKFVLQANYADSSGTHNGSLLRLILDTWYDATFGTNSDEYKLRTAPQLFASGKTITHNDARLNEDGSWIEGYGVNAGYNRTWPDITGKAFPYTIRNAADSFPCAVFYKDPEQDEYEHFLGQYVFMDDKKSDYLYGERSIYAFGDYTDPFVMNINNTKNGINGKLDTDENMVWDNSKVLRIEIVLPNTNVTSYMGMDVPTTLVLNDSGDVESTSGSLIDCREIKYDKDGNPVKFFWEDYFEMIYPDPDDIENEKVNGVSTYTKFDQNSKFRRTAQPFIDFLTWITGISALNVNGQGQQYHNGTVTQAALNKFKQEAHNHLDLYKLAAYYIFFLRFGLVDSVERNAQLKTYDGQHWHYEPWDMDIALGNTNQGALVLNPPLDRDSLIPGTSTKAFSGRGESTSNFMWDCLEAWDDWANKIVPEVAEALYKAGLTYDNVIKMFDGNYSDKWAESLYNEAGYFKYIEHGGGEFLPWLQGSRISHRHWWLSTSMNYYDSKWACGTFKDKRVVLFVDKGSHTSGTDIVRIKPTANTYFEITADTGKASIEKKAATPTNPALFDISSNLFSAKDPTWIYGGLFIEELDLSCFARTMATVDVSLCYDKVLGANIKYLNIGVPTTGSGGTKTGAVSGTKLRLSAVDSFTGSDALEELITLDVTGQSSIINTAGIFTQNDRTSLRNFYAAGTSITSFENAPSGNTFDNLVLPASTEVINPGGVSSTSTIDSFVMHNASWDNIEFWDTSATSAPIQIVDETTGEPVFVEDEEGNAVPVYEPASATYTKLSEIPATLRIVTFDGSTARSENSLKFVLDWVHSVATTLSSYDSSNDTYDSDELHTALKSKRFRAENINWTDSFETRLTYEDLENIAYLNGTHTTAGGVEVFDNYTNKYIKGYVVITGSLTAQQMVNIKRWFGESAFDKSARYSQLVVDSTSNMVVINIDDVVIDNGAIELEEGHSAPMLATKFLLGDSAGENYITAPGLEMQSHMFIWSIADGTDFSVSNVNQMLWGDTVKSCSLQISQNDGRVHLVASEGDFGDYDVVVRVQFINDLGVQDYAYLVVHILGTTYPSGYQLSVTGTGLREFHADSATYMAMFPSFYSFGGETVPAYVLHTPNQQLNITVTPQGSYTAQIKHTLFNIIKVSTEASVTGGFLEIAAVNAANYQTMQTQDVNEYIGYNSNSNSIYTASIVAGPSLPQACVAYQIRIKVLAGARAEQYKVVNVVVLQDSAPVLLANNANGVYLALRSKYNTDYGMQSASSLYKTDLIGISGTTTFTSYASTVSTLESAMGDSVLRYMPNVTGLDFTNCTSFTTLASTFDFTNCSKLTLLSLNGCNLLSGKINITGATSLASVDLRNTSLSIEIPENSVIVSLQLGTPTSVIMNSPATFGDSGTTISIQDQTNLNDIQLLNVNKSTVCGFTVFDNIYGGS